MANIIKKIRSTAKHRTTYRAGILQAKAYRVLKTRTNEHLAGKGISSVEWALLGLVGDMEEGINLKDVAEEIGVEPPFITRLVKKLIEMNLVSVTPDPNDSRVKIAMLTLEGKEFVSSTEVHLRNVMRPLLEGISLRELASYLVVLEQIIENSRQLD